LRPVCNHWKGADPRGSISRFIFAFILFGAGGAYGDALSDLRSVSVFKDADLSRLANGEILAQRGPQLGLARGIVIESAFAVHASVPQAAAGLEQFSPARHSELRTYLQGDLGSSPSPSDFQRLSSAPNNSSVKAFVTATESLPGDSSRLQLSKQEPRLFQPSADKGNVPASVTAFWSQVLTRRAKEYLSGGLSGLSPYETGGNNLKPGEELSRLVREDAKIRSQFSSLIEATPLGGGRGSISPSLYWSLFEGDNEAEVALGASYGKNVGDGWQGVDLQYYASGDVNVTATFYQMWPVSINGSPGTLVWRSDLISSSSIGELRGVERMGSGSALLREIQKNVRALLRDLPARK
jgi:hypothetical protein